MKQFSSSKTNVLIKLIGVCYFIFVLFSCSKTSAPALVKLSSCDSIQKGLLLKQSDTIRLRTCVTIYGCDSIRLGLLKPTSLDSIRLSNCLKISSCDSVRLGLLRPTTSDTIRLSNCIKITGCDSIRLGLLKPTRADTIRLSNCIKITGCDSIRLGLLNPTRADTIRLSNCIRLSGCDSIRLGLLKLTQADTVRLSNCIRLSGCDSLRLGILELTKLNSDRLRCLVTTVGQFYQGGKIAYILQPGDPGYDVKTPHGIIASLSDQTDQNSGIKWALNYTTIGANGRDIGTGLSNTLKIINDQLETPLTNKMYAASLAKGYNGGGYTDWFLPSIEELNKLYINKTMTNGLYWSSTERDGSNAWLQAWYIDFSSGQQTFIHKVAALWKVRAIRYF